MENRVFLDTSFSIALTIAKDEFHSIALNLAEQIWTNEIKIITTQVVIIEIGNALSKLKYRRAAVKIIEQLESDSNVEITSLTDELYNSAFNLFRNRLDKEWGLIDCISFIVMRERGMTEALTADEHFVQAGFRALLRER